MEKEVKYCLSAKARANLLPVYHPRLFLPYAQLPPVHDNTPLSLCQHIPGHNSHAFSIDSPGSSHFCIDMLCPLRPYVQPYSPAALSAIVFLKYCTTSCCIDRYLSVDIPPSLGGWTLDLYPVFYQINIKIVDQKAQNSVPDKQGLPVRYSLCPNNVLLMSHTQ